jgi:hypothetical protein
MCGATKGCSTGGCLVGMAVAGLRCWYDCCRTVVGLRCWCATEGCICEGWAAERTMACGPCISGATYCCLVGCVAGMVAQRHALSRKSALSLLMTMPVPGTVRACKAGAQQSPAAAAAAAAAAEGAAAAVNAAETLRAQS